MYALVSISLQFSYTFLYVLYNSKVIDQLCTYILLSLSNSVETIKSTIVFHIHRCEFYINMFMQYNEEVCVLSVGSLSASGDFTHWPPDPGQRPWTSLGAGLHLRLYVAILAMGLHENNPKCFSAAALGVIH
jgi:hypothetical protein